MWAQGKIHTTHIYAEIGPPRQAKFFGFFMKFWRAARPQIEGFWPRGRYGLLTHLFLSSGSYGGLRRREKQQFPSRSRNQKFFHFLSKNFWAPFWRFYPPKRPNLAPGPSPACSPCFFTPGDFRRARETPVRPRSAISAPDTFWTPLTS